MSKLSKTIQALKLIAKNPWLLNKVIDDDRNWQEKINKKYHLTDGLPVVDLLTEDDSFAEVVSPYASLDGSSLPTDLALLKKLARSFQDCSYFEIGTWRGESVANVAAVAKKCFTLNLSTDQMRKLGMDDRYINLHGFFSKGLSNVVHLQGDSREFDFAALDRKFDLIFIDGDHHYEVVKNDTRKVFQHLVHDQSVVVWHDYAYNPEKIRFEVMAAILDGTPAESHSRIFHAANTMCAVFMNKPPEGAGFESPQTPKGFFELNITWQK